ncbi:Uncharacterised protein [Pragia fontium]|uniref:hypothetical protein n=1 Tax=Pragia fontium TaxID=82985 RepID=UPI000E07A8EF|nr:hypothetical protein [Pragia fontium]SUB82008.1 Uncharacterised protein [Pragia fontium]
MSNKVYFIMVFLLTFISATAMWGVICAIAWEIMPFDYWFIVRLSFLSAFSATAISHFFNFGKGERHD